MHVLSAAGVSVLLLWQASVVAVCVGTAAVSWAVTKKIVERLSVGEQ